MPLRPRLLSDPGALAHLRRALPPKAPITAAIAFATTDEHLPLREGDTIVVNASVERVRAGVTDPRLIARWLEAGVEVSSNSDLHAKVVVCGNWVAVGSGNLSSLAATSQIEAMWVSNDPSLRKQTREFIVGVASEAVPLTETWVREHRHLFALDRPTIAKAMKRTPLSIVTVGGHPRRLVLAYWSPDERLAPGYVQNIQPPRRLPTRFEQTNTFLDGARWIEVGDLLVWVEPETGIMSPPAKIWTLPTYGSHEATWAVGYEDTDLGAKRLPEIGAAGVELQSEHWVVVDDADRRNQILGSWGLTWP